MRTPAYVVGLGVATVGLLVLARCSFSIDPNQGHFSCVNAADCASGQECIPQADGGNGLCYPIGQCVPETCNGLDDDCDGVVDDHQPCGQGAACVDAGCLSCADGFDGGDGCADAQCAGASCVLDGGPQRCLPKFLLPDGGLADAGTGPPTYRCDFP